VFKATAKNRKVRDAPGWLKQTLNQRVVGSSPTAPTIKGLKSLTKKARVGGPWWMKK
jgi:hypothetical protein